MNREKPRGTFAITIVAHVAFFALLFWVLSIPAPFTQWLAPKKQEFASGERIVYMRIPPGATIATLPPGMKARAPRGGAVATQRLVAPTVVPTTSPDAKPGASKGEAAEESAPVIAGGAGPGIEPEMHDPRVWLPPGAVIYVPRPDNAKLFDTGATRLAIKHYQDSLMKKQADALKTVFEAGGKKYGVDGQNIYIADFKIPSALLSLIPIHPTGYATPDQAALARQTADINYQAGRALDAEDFKTAIKRIRMRKEREHEAALAAQGKGPAPSAAIPFEAPVHKEIRTDPIALQAP
ncbi:MAG TPA: hypothetical protein VMT93_10035 [Gemmatimonadaceae bacterium]|nr:hypothetical protein [Gemmatimonadaceae bacterium]